jgi:hemerythrin-like domain-containing protein
MEGEEAMAMRDNDAEPFADAIEMLKADHQRVRDLFQQYEREGDPDSKRAVAAQVFVELETHAQLEEMVFYPAVAEETEEEGQQLVEEAQQEHQTVKELIAALRELEPDTQAFAATFHELQQHVAHHVAEEEQEMFPLAEVELQESMEDMADEMQTVKQQILAS